MASTHPIRIRIFAELGALGLMMGGAGMVWWMTRPAPHRAAESRSHNVPKASRSQATTSATTSGPNAPLPAAHQRSGSYPSLSQRVAHQPVATVTMIHAAMRARNPAELGTLKWSTADAKVVFETMGRVKAPAAVTRAYAELAVYAVLANNTTVFQSPVYHGTANPAAPTGSQSETMQGVPDNISQIDQLIFAARPQRPVPFQMDYAFTVVCTTTAGHIATRYGTVGLQYALGGVPAATYWRIDGADLLLSPPDSPSPVGQRGD